MLHLSYFVDELVKKNKKKKNNACCPSFFFFFIFVHLVYVKDGPHKYKRKFFKKIIKKATCARWTKMEKKRWTTNITKKEMAPSHCHISMVINGIKMWILKLMGHKCNFGI
jgi:hypothetical protein